MAKIESSIGLKAKKLRDKSNMTLKELSKKTNLSVGYLSQFERGINTIAIDSLSKIAKVYGVELNYFFPETSEEKESIIMKSYEHSFFNVIGTDYIVNTLYNKSETKDDHSMYPRLIEILPKFSREKIQLYAHAGEEFIYVLEGILTFYYNKEIHHLYPGDSAYYSSEVEHNWDNETNKKVKIMCVSTPNPFASTNDEDPNLMIHK